MATKAEKEKAEELDNSAQFDVHRWSDYPEVNNAVDALYEELKTDPSFKGRKNIRKKHIKVIVLDLYVKWLTDPTMYSSFYRRKGYYTTLDSRYNKLHISKITADIADALQRMEYIEHVKGHYGRSGGSSHISRMRSTDKLIQQIVAVHHITPEMVELAPNTECIILRDLNQEKTKQIDIPYEDTADTKRMREKLYAYNNLLRQIFIDIPEYPTAGIPTKSGKKRIRITQHEKFVRRIFNNGTWDQGGRYYGGWWQRIPKDWRAKIRIWNTPVTEIDYSGLHIILLYALNGIDYWAVIGTDPYQIAGIEESERMRDLLKQVLLSAINAKDKSSAVKGVRWTINSNNDDYGWVNEEILT